MSDKNYVKISPLDLKSEFVHQIYLQGLSHDAFKKSSELLNVTLKKLLSIKKILLLNLKAINLIKSNNLIQVYKSKLVINS